MDVLVFQGGDQVCVLFQVGVDEVEYVGVVCGLGWDCWQFDVEFWQYCEVFVIVCLDGFVVCLDCFEVF